MANRLYTTFQNMSKVFDGSWNVSNGIANLNPEPIGNEVVYTTDDPQKLAQKKLEMQQNNYLKNRWIKANQNLSMSAFAGLSNIKLMYRDADLMDSYPEIGAAIDIVAEESTLSTSESHGMIVKVSSKSDRIKSILEDLFVNRLNLQVTAQMVMRAMCKYGNQFMLLDIDKDLGIKGWRQLPVAEVERIENGIINPYGGGQVMNMTNDPNAPKDLSTRFVWTNEQGGQMVPFRNWQIAHFRLLHNSLFLPYGCIVGDTRIETEFGYKEIKDIKIGDKVWTFNVDSQQRELANVTMQMNKGEKDVFELRTFHNQIEGTSDHKLLCYENNKLTYKEIKDINIGDLLIIDNSRNKCDQTIKIDKSFPTENEASLYRATGWWNKDIGFIPDYVDEKFARFFGFMLGDGWISHNKDIQFAVGVYDSLNKEFVDYLESITSKKARWIKPYKTQYANTTNGYMQVVVSSKTLAIIMRRMGFKGKCDTKRFPNWIYSCNDTIKKAFLSGLMAADGSYNIDKYGILRCSLELCNEQMIKDAKTLVQSLGYKSGKISHRVRKNLVSAKLNHKTIREYSDGYYFYYFESYNTQEKKYDLNNRLNEGFKTEKVRFKEYIGKKETFDITVSNNNSNFFANGIITHNCSILLSARRHFRMLALMEDSMLIYRLERSMERRVYKIYVGALDDADIAPFIDRIADQFKRTPIVDPLTGQLDLRKNLLSQSEDVFIPVRSEQAATPIDTLPAAKNLDAIDDIKYIQKKVCAALRIPQSFLNFEEAQGDGKNLALMDVRFARTINKYQQAFLMELTKIATIHLYLLGFEDDLTNFNLTMNNPSTQAEQLEIDNLQKKISAVRDAVSDPGNGIPPMSIQRALKEILKWSDKEIKENFEEIRLEKALAAEYEKTAQIIKRTGIFDNVDRIYGEPGAEYQEEQGGPQGPDGGGPMGGGGGFGGGLDSLGSPASDEGMDVQGEEGAEPTQEMGGEPQGQEPQGTNQEAMPMESVKYKHRPILTETKNLSSNNCHATQIFNQIVENMNKKQHDGEIKSRVDVYDKSLMISEEFDSMFNVLEDFKNSTLDD